MHISAMFLAPAVVAIAAMMFHTSAADGHCDCVEAPGLHCVTFVCSSGAGFSCLLQFPDELQKHNPNPKGKKNDHKWESWSIPGGNGKHRKPLVADFVHLQLGNTIQNLKVPNDMVLNIWSNLAGIGKHADVKITKSGEAVCSGGFLTPSRKLK